MSHPPVVVLAAGGWSKYRETYTVSEETAQSEIAELRHRIAELESETVDAVEEAAEEAHEVVSEDVETVTEDAEATPEEVAEAAHDVAEQVHEAAESASDHVGVPDTHVDEVYRRVMERLESEGRLPQPHHEPNAEVPESGGVEVLPDVAEDHVEHHEHHEPSVDTIHPKAASWWYSWPPRLPGRR